MNTSNNVNDSIRATYASNKKMRITYDELGNSIFTYSINKRNVVFA